MTVSEIRTIYILNVSLKASQMSIVVIFDYCRPELPDNSPYPDWRINEKTNVSSLNIALSREMDFQRQSLLAYLEDSGFDILDDWYPRADQDAIRAELEARVDSYRNVFGFDLEYSGVDGRVYAVVAIHNNIYQGYI